MVRGRADGGDRGVAAGEPLRAGAAQPQRPGGDQQLGRVQAQAAVSGGEVQAARVQVGQQRPAAREVDRAPVIRVDQGEPGKLAALVDVGHPRHRELDELGAERVGQRVARDRGDELPDRARQLRVVERPGGQAEHRRLVLGVRVRPRGAPIRLADRLRQVAGQPLAADRPRADEGLPDQVLGVRVDGGGRQAGRCPLMPLCHLAAPALGHLGQHREPGPDVLLALGVVGGQGGHGERPVGRQPLGLGVEGLGRDPEPVGVAAHLVEREQPRPPVEGRVLDPLGQHRAGRLLEPHDELAARPPRRSPAGAGRARPAEIVGQPAERRAAAAGGPPRPRPAMAASAAADGSSPGCT